jgi:N-acetylglucosamine-6-sulfatase
MGHPFLETPHLDALAQGGVLFDNAFVTMSLCSPSRASILTGQYAHTHGILNNSTNLPDTTPTFPKELQKAGYRTGFTGKWHMGGSSDEPRPGFDHWMSFRGQGQYIDPTLNINGTRGKVEGYVTDLITDHAVNFIKERDDRPFFLYASHKAVHADFYPAERHQGRYADQTFPHPASMANTKANYKGKPQWVRAQRNSWHGVDGMYNKRVDFDQFARDYAETMLAVDESVGRIVQTLRDEGLLDSTLLVFTSDNGFLFGEHGLIDKRCMYEPSIRVPLIAHCPELFAGGARKNEVVANIDFAPTFLECAGAPIPDTVQGRSFLGVLTGAATAWRDALLYEYFWERSFPQTPSVLGVRTERYKFMKYHGVWDRYEIYDLQEDPDEMNNLLGAYLQGNEAGELENFIRRNAPEDIKNLFNDLDGKLDALLKETGCLAEPSWHAAT